MHYEKGAVSVTESVLAVEAMCRVRSVDEAEVEVFSIDCKFLLTYSFDSAPPTGNDLEDFADTIVKFNAWPYIREYVQAMALRMQFNPPPLPLLRSLPLPGPEPALDRLKQQAPIPPKKAVKRKLNSKLPPK
jgi:hypothetical protein